MKLTNKERVIIMNKDKKRELLETLQSGDNKQFYKKYEVVETFIGTVEREVDIFSTDNNDSREVQNWDGEYVYNIYEIYTCTIVYEGHFLDELELIEELEAELER